MTDAVEEEVRSMELYQSEIGWKTFIPPLPTHQVSVLWINSPFPESLVNLYIK
jgi:hypothetical protein